MTHQYTSVDINRANALTYFKLVLAGSLIILLLLAPTELLLWRISTITLFIVIAMLDVADGRVAFAHAQSTRRGVILDRSLDYPMLLCLIYIADVQVRGILLWSKLLIDSLILIVLISKPRPPVFSIRTLLQYTTLFALLLMVLGFENRYLTTHFINTLLAANILFSIIALLYHLNILQKRFIADTLSMCNLACGLAAIYMASLQRLDLSLLFILIGGLFDGLDGFAARKWGGTRFGVYSDDIADAVSYGIAPAASLYLHLTAQGDYFIEALLIGVAYAVFTISRLVFFTLNKSSADPNYFRGVPSTLGGILVVSSCYLFGSQTLLIAFFIGVACILMINFDTQFRHLGRLFSQRKPFRLSAAGFAALLLICGVAGQITLAIAALFIATLCYGFLPTVLHFYRIIRK